jgi:hypothetical protein
MTSRAFAYLVRTAFAFDEQHCASPKAASDEMREIPKSLGEAIPQASATACQLSCMGSPSVEL